MDTNVLAEQRRETVINLLKGMKIKKTDGDGFDKDDVYLCMQQLCDVYEKNIDDLTTSYEEQMAELQDKYQKYDENNDLYISLIMEAKKSSNEIITKAKAEVDEILANGKKEIAKQEEELEQLRKSAEQEKMELQAASEKARADAEKEKAAIAEEVNAERDRAVETKATYKRRLEAMEKEFDEIKTNILRTAGKIDGLKAQMNEQEESPDWIVKDTIGRVDEPEADIAVEDAVEVDVPPVLEVEPVVAPEAEAPAESATDEARVESFSFDDLVAKLQNDEFAADAPAQEAPQAAEIDLPDMADEPAVEIPAAPVAEPAIEIPATPAAEPSIEIPAAPVAEPAIEIPAAPAAEPAIEIPAEPAPAPEEVGLSDLDGLAGEELEIQLPEVDLPEEETPIEEISFEGLEELFKE